VPRGAKSRMRKTETPKPIWIKFCTVVDISDVVTYTNFGDHRLRGSWVAGGQISPSPIDFHRRPYNTLALPCERVIWFTYQSAHNTQQFRLKVVWTGRFSGDLSVYKSKNPETVQDKVKLWHFGCHYRKG